MVSQIENINAIIQFTPGEGKVWSGVLEVVPSGMWVLDTDTNIVYIGDGVNFIGDLPPFWDLNFGDTTVSTIAQLPNDISSYPLRILTVNSAGDGYVIGSININEVVTITELNALLTTLADLDHEHGDIYYTKDEIIAKALAKSSFDSYEANIISMLVLDAMDRDSEIYKLLPNGVADEFIDESGVDSNSTAVYRIDGQSYAVEGFLLTVPAAAGDNVIQTSTLLRANLNDTGGVGIDIEISRDGGSNFAIANTRKSNMTCADIEFLTGICDFSQQRVSAEIDLTSAVTIEDLKGNITTINMDSDYFSAHLDAAVTENLVGCQIKTPSGNITIKEINGDGTTPGDLIVDSQFVSPSTLDVNSITKTVLDDDTISRHEYNNNIFQDATNAPRERRWTANTIIDDEIYVYGGHTAERCTDLWKYNLTSRKWKLIDIAVTPENARDATLVNINNKLYLFGGIDREGNILDTLHCFDPKTSEWTQLASCISTLCEHAAVAYKNSMYVFGGRNDSNYYHSLYRYDPVSDTWIQLTAGASDRSYFAMVMYDDKFYIYGGSDGSTVYSDVWEYDITTDTWTQKTSCSEVTSQGSTAVYGSKMYIFGGHNNGGTSAAVLSYDMSNDTWDTTSHTDMPVKFKNSGGGRALVYNDTVYLATGYNDTPATGEIVSTIYVYNFTSNTWAVEYIMPPNRYRTEMCICDGKMYLGGGRRVTDNDTLDDFWTYDFGTERWTKLANLPQVLYLHSLCAIGNKLYLYGGYNNVDTIISDELWEYDTSTGVWTQKASNLITYGHTSVSINNKLYVYGGIQNSIRCDDLWEYDPTTNAWTQLSSDGNGDRYNAKSTVYDGKMYVFGGTSVSSTYYQDLLEYDPSTDTWVTLAADAAGRLLHGFTVIEDKLYIIGGIIDGVRTDDIWEYNFTTEVWTQLCEDIMLDMYINCVTYHNKIFMFGRSSKVMPTLTTINFENNPLEVVTKNRNSNAFAGGCLVGDEVYIFGGDVPVIGSNNLSGKYNLITKEYTPIKSLPINVHKHAVVSYGTDIYILGGIDNADDTLYNNLYKYDIFADTYTELTGYTVPICNIGFVAYSGKLYAGGGYNGTAYSKAFWEYDIITDTWTELADVLDDYDQYYSAEYNTMRAYNGKIYITAGRNLTHDHVSGTTVVYDISSGVWSTLHQRPTTTFGEACAEYNNEIYVFGGRLDVAKDTGEFWKYSPSTSVWTLLSSGPTARRSSTLSLVGTKMYVFGGYSDGVGYLNDTWEYDTATDTWTDVTPVTNPPIRYAHVAVGYGTKMYIQGGMDASVDLDDIWEFDTVAGTWTELATGGYLGRSHTACIIGDKIYCIGGYSGGTSYNESIYIYDITNNTWSTIVLDRDPATNISITIDGTDIYLFGGWNTTIDASNALTILHKYDTVGDTWTQLTSLSGEFSSATMNRGVSYNGKLYIPDERVINEYDLTSNEWNRIYQLPSVRYDYITTLYEDKIYIFGGINSLGYLDDVWEYDITNNVYTEVSIVDMPTAANGIALVHNSDIYICFGIKNGDYDNSVGKVDLTENTFEHYIQSSPNETYLHGQAVIGDDLYITGGRLTTGDHHVVTQCWKYNIPNGTWTRLTDIPLGLFNPICVTYGRYIYVMSGRHYDGSTFHVSNAVYRYDIVQDTWLQLVDMPIVAWNMGHVLVGHKLYIFGGLTGTSSNDARLNTTYVYNLLSGIWTQLVSMPNLTHGSGAIEHDGIIYNFGGYKGVDTTASNVITAYDISLNVYTTLSINVPVEGSVIYAQPCKIGGKVYLFGIIDTIDSNVINVLYIFDLSTHTFESTLLPGEAGYARDDVNIYNDKFYMFGGYNYLNSDNISGLKKYTPQIIPEAPALLTYDTEVANVDNLMTIGDDINLIYTCFLIGSEYVIFQDNAYKEVVKEDTVWQYLDENGTWVAADINTVEEAIKQALMVSTNQISLNTLNSNILKEVTITKWYFVCETSEDVTINSMKILSGEAATFAEGNSIVTKITNHRASDIEVLGMRTRW